MGRPIRIEFPGALYHVMSRGVNGCSIFQDDLDRRRFLHLMEELVNCRKLAIYAFCLMVNHFHLLCETPIGRLSRWMQQLLSGYTRGFNCRQMLSWRCHPRRWGALP
jgi:putative transposase